MTKTNSEDPHESLHGIAPTRQLEIARCYQSVLSLRHDERPEAVRRRLSDDVSAQNEVLDFLLDESGDVNRGNTTRLEHALSIADAGNSQSVQSIALNEIFLEIPRHRIVRRLRQGGIGSVYEASFYRHSHGRMRPC